MELVLLWLICGGVAAAIANNRGGSGWVAFFAGLLLGPFGIIIACFMGSPEFKAAKQIRAGELKKCPRCAEGVLPDALVCKHCGHEFAAAA